MPTSPRTSSLVFRVATTLLLLASSAVAQVVLTAPAGPVVYGQPVALTATVNTGLTGKVTFFDGATPLGVAAISANQATLSTVMLPTGTRMLRATYGGDGGVNGPANSASVPLTVNSGPSLGFKAPAATTVTGGQNTVADFNGDGKLDVAVAATNGVNVSLGNGDGTFQSPVRYTTGGSTLYLAAGDFDGDGKVDIATTNYSSPFVSILGGNGDGTFKAAVNNSAFTVTGPVAAGDFNGDGKLDLAVSARYGSWVAVALGNGDGTFQTPTTYTVGSYPQSLVVADINGDGKADLITSNSYGGSVSVLLGAGDGTFGTAVTTSVASNPGTIAVGDLNGDGKLDLVVATYAGMTTLLGDGTGAFATRGVSLYGYYLQPVVLSDFNGDGKLDALLGSSGNEYLLYGVGDGTFLPLVSYSTSSTGSSYLVAADFDRDGKVDVIAASAGASMQFLAGGGLPDLAITQVTDAVMQGQSSALHTVTVTNSGDVATNGAVQVVESLGAPFTATSISGSGWTCTLATVSCVRPDALAPQASYPPILVRFSVSETFSGAASSTATVSGGGEQNAANNTATSSSFVRLSTATSLATSANPAVLGQTVTLTATVTRGTGTVTFFDGAAPLGSAALNGTQAVYRTNQLPPGAHSLRAEYAGDATYGPSLSSALRQSISPNAENGTQTAATYKPASGVAQLLMGDFNGDGKVDLVTESASTAIQLGNGDGTFGASTSISSTAYASLVAADFNADGKLDLAGIAGSYIYVLLGNGDGTFKSAAAVFSPNNSSATALQAADFNGDGKIDLAFLLNSNGAQVAVLPGNGDGTFGAMRSVATGTYYLYLFSGDLNGDGKADLVAANNWTEAPAAILLGNGDGTFQISTAAVATSYGQPVALGDVNGDGKLDIVTCGYATWSALGNGDGTFQTPIQSTGNWTPMTRGILADVNGDGKLDLIASAYYASRFYIAFGNGDGTFSAQLTSIAVTDTNPAAFVAGDFNGDGRLDVAAGGSVSLDIVMGVWFAGLTPAVSHAMPFIAGQTAWYQIVVTNPMFATLTGTVTVTDSLPAGITATAMAGDGWTCTVATLTCTRTDTYGIAMGGSYPPIRLSVAVSSALSPATLTNRATATLNGMAGTGSDATAIYASSGVTVVASPSPATFGRPVTLTAYVTGGTSGKVLFLDGVTPLGSATVASGTATFTTSLLPAGQRSLRATYSGDGTYGPGTSAIRLLTVHAGTASGFGGAQTYTTTAGPVALAIADFNGDGKPDVVTANGPGGVVSVLLGGAAGVLGAKTDYAVGTWPSAVVTADFNADGKTDIATANRDGSSFSVLLGKGDGTFQPAASTPMSVTGSSILAADFNGDGIVDLAAGSSYSLFIYLGNGDGTFRQTGPSVGSNYAPVLGDFNGDGKVDIAVLYYSNLNMYFGNGDGTFVNGPSSYVSSNSSPDPVADLNGDGKLDLIVGDYNSGVNVSLGKGDGTFQPGAHYGTGSALAVTIGDMNGDGKLDIVYTTSGGVISILLGNGDGTFAAQPVNYSFGTPVQTLTIADMDGDGRSDVIISSQAANSISILPGMLTPILTITSAHTGAFYAGQTNATYVLTVANKGPAGTTGTVTVTDALPASMAATAMSGAGWTCDANSLMCTRADALAPGANYPPITMIVTVAPNAPSQATNATNVSGGGAVPGSYSDATTIVAPFAYAGTMWPSTMAPATPWVNDAPVTLGTAFQSDKAGVVSGIRFYKGAGNTGTHVGILYSASGSVLAQATFTNESASGWQQANFAVPVPIVANTTYVAAYFSTGGYAYTAGYFADGAWNNPPLHALPSGRYAYGASPAFPSTTAAGMNYWTDVSFTGATDPVLTPTATHSGSFTQGQTGATYTITMTNTGYGATSGTVTVTETLPPGLTLVSMSGAGWTCPPGGNTCTRSDGLAPGSSYPNVTVAVNVAANAAVSLTNTVTASGGGAASAIANNVTTIVALSGLRFVPMTPCRIADTRIAGGWGGPQIAGGTTRNFVMPNSACAVPAGVLAYSLNVAVVPSGPLGYLTVWPAGQPQPLASTLNSLDGRIKSNAAIVPAGSDGAISVFASNTTNVILDINGYFVPATDPAALAFYPVAPCRVVDTRNVPGQFGGPSLAGGQSRTFAIRAGGLCNIPPTAQAYSLNFAAVPQGPLGYITAWPTGQARPLVSTLNALTGTVTANAAIVPAGTSGSVDVFASNTTDIVIDINGYFAPMTTGGLSLYPLPPCRVLDTRQPGAAPFSGALPVAVADSGCGAPGTAQAHVLSATVVPAAPVGYVTLWPQGQSRPNVATLNALDGTVTSNLAIVPTTSGSISVFPSNPTHLVLDIFGYFAQ